MKRADWSLIYKLFVLKKVWHWNGNISSFRHNPSQWAGLGRDEYIKPERHILHFIIIISLAHETRPTSGTVCTSS